MKRLFIILLILVLLVTSVISYILLKGETGMLNTRDGSNITDALNKNSTPYWAYLYGNDIDGKGFGIQQTADNGYIIAGDINLPEARQSAILVVKLNSNGTIAWQKAYGMRSSIAMAKSIRQTSDGGYIVAGKAFSFEVVGWDIWILKLKNDGTIEWQKTYGGNKADLAESIQQTTDGGYIISGDTTSFGNGDMDILVLKLNADGTVAWQKTFGDRKDDTASSIQQTTDGGYILNGYTELGGTANAVWILKLDVNGQVIWQKSYVDMENSRPASIQQTTDGGYIVAGSGCPCNVQTADFWVLKLKNDGTVEWEKSYGSDKGEIAESIQQTPDDGYIVAGTKYSRGAGEEDIWVLKLKNDGAIEWQKTYGGQKDDKLGAIQQTSDGYIIVGYTSDKKGFSNMWVFKINKDGLIPTLPSLGIDTNVSPQQSEYFSYRRPGIWEGEDITGRRYYTYSDTHVYPRNDILVVFNDTHARPVDTKAIIMK